MSRKIPISVCLFVATRDRHGYTDCYKHTIQRLNENIPLSEFANLSSHVKITNQEELPVFNEMDSWLGKMGFKVIETVKQWDKGDGGHQHSAGYYEDMLKLLNQQSVQDQPYILFLEDDWLINCNNLISYFSQACDLLRSNKDVLCVRINNEDDPINDNLDLAEKVTENIFLQTMETNPDYGPSVTFQPTIFRSRDWLTAVRHINKDWEKIKNQHCELISGYYLKSLFTDNLRPFAFFDPRKVSCTHIGTKEFAEKQLNG